ncbi:MAG: hypothetical protein AAF182_03670 [Pseudomonadota bacterium]
MKFSKMSPVSQFEIAVKRAQSLSHVAFERSDIEHYIQSFDDTENAKKIVIDKLNEAVLADRDSRDDSSFNQTTSLVSEIKSGLSL